VNDSYFLTVLSKTAAISLTLAAMPVVGLAENLVVNSSFEKPNAIAADNGATINRDNGLDSTWYAGANIDGWTVGQNSVDLMLDTLVNAADGHQSIDLNGDYGLGGSVYQDLTTVPGHWYRLKFALSGNYNLTTQYGPNPEIKSVQVQWRGAALADISLRPASDSTEVPALPETVLWSRYEYYVQATSTKTRLEFVSTTPTPTAYGVLLDAVSVEPVGKRSDDDKHEGSKHEAEAREH
jgi:Protein of unknown function (DUF642)